MTSTHPSLDMLSLGNADTERTARTAFKVIDAIQHNRRREEQILAAAVVFQTIADVFGVRGHEIMQAAANIRHRSADNLHLRAVRLYAERHLQNHGT